MNKPFHQSRHGIITAALVVFASVVAVGVCLFLYVSIGFGNAVVNTVKGVHEAKREWKMDTAAPIDSLYNKVDTMLSRAQ